MEFSNPAFDVGKVSEEENKVKPALKATVAVTQLSREEHKERKKRQCWKCFFWRNLETKGETDRYISDTKYILTA